ncbi:peroxiredoxin [bacterium]|nr:peroxiredoxin [bacterium]
MLEVGSPIPDITLRGVNPAGEEGEYRLADLLVPGKDLVLYFYPKDDTPGCTTEACDFRDGLATHGEKVVVVGVSPDAPTKHLKFQTKYGLPFTLLSDTENKLMELFGAWGEKKNYGKVYVGVIRSTFVIGADGVLKAVYRNVKATGHAERIYKSLA